MDSTSARLPAVSERGRRAVAVAALVVFAALTVRGLRDRTTGGIHEFVGGTMGTAYSVRIDERLSAGEREDARLVIVEELGRVNRLMSTYDPVSELSRFNRHASTAPFAVSDDLLEVLTIAHDVSTRSGGAFDATVAPLVNAWGFGPTGMPTSIPDEAFLEELRARVGYDRIVVDREAGTVAKTHPEAVVDLSGVAKGYGAERVADALAELGRERFLVEVGGELKAVGTRHDGRPWRVGVERPDAFDPGVWGTIDVTDEGVATSGDYRNFYEEGGVRYAHIIDPRTGQPIRMSGFAVTVVHQDAAVADAWATALTVLGPEEGYDLARREGLAALFVRQAEEGLRSLITPALEGRFATVDEGH